jgi:predicted metal-binding membrane protein
MTPAARERLHVRLPLFAASGAAWALLIAGSHAAGFCSMGPIRITALLTGSVVMFAAMMLPALGPPILHVSTQSFAARRLRSIALFVAAYGAVWIAAGVVLLLAAAAAAQSGAAIAATLVACGLWQCSPSRQRCLNRCHNHTVLSAFGRAADRDAFVFGLAHGFWCAASCSALMLVPMLFSGAHVPLAAAVTCWIAGERLERPAVPRWQLRWPRKATRIAIGQLRARLGTAGSRRLVPA